MDGPRDPAGGALSDSGNFDWMAHAENSASPLRTTLPRCHLRKGIRQGRIHQQRVTAQSCATSAPLRRQSIPVIMGMHLDLLGVRMERHCATHRPWPAARRRSARQLGELPGPRNGQVPCAGGEVHAERYPRISFGAGNSREAVLPRPSEDGVHRHVADAAARCIRPAPRASPAHRGAA